MANRAFNLHDHADVIYIAATLNGRNNRMFLHEKRCRSQGKQDFIVLLSQHGRCHVAMQNAERLTKVVFMPPDLNKKPLVYIVGRNYRKYVKDYLYIDKNS